MSYLGRHRIDDDDWFWDDSHNHHLPCPSGCGMLADECECPDPNPLGNMRIEPPIGSDTRGRQ
jgi:hypothetical protein